MKIIKLIMIIYQAVNSLNSGNDEKLNISPNELRNTSMNKRDKENAIIFYLDILNFLASYVTIQCYFYIIEPCELSFFRCYQTSVHKVYKWTFYAALFVICHFTQFFRGCKNKNYLNIVYSLIVFLYMTNQRPGFDWVNHGSYAKLVCYIILVAQVFVLLSAYLIRKYCVRILLLFKIVFFVSIVFIAPLTHFSIIYSKRNFNRGFNNQWLSKNQHNFSAECDFKDYYFPNYDLGIKITVPMQWFLNVDCKNSKETEFYQFFNTSVNDDPQTNNYQVYPNLHPLKMDYNIYDIDHDLQNFISDNLKFYRNKSEFRADYWINFEDKSNPYLEIDIKEKAIPTQTNGKLNILSIMLDTISRQQFFRSYPKTVEYMQKFFDSEQRKNLQSSGFEFFRGQSWIGYTSPNLEHYRFGGRLGGRYKESLEGIAKKKGYVTAYTTTQCCYYDISYNAHPDEDRHDKEDMTKCDHDNIGLACDRAVYPDKDPFGPLKGPFSVRQRCILGENLSKHNYDFILDFHRKYHSVPKYSFTHIMDGHEMTTQVPSYGDEELRTLLETLEKEKILENTLLVLFSDHGQHIAPFNSENQGMIEQLNFMCNILVPNKYLTHEMEYNLKTNSQRLLSHKDIHKTLIQIMRNEKNSSRNIIDTFYLYDAFDLLNETIDQDRSCDDIVRDEEDCLCKKSE